MNPQVKRQRLESLLQEVLNEAFAQLNDPLLNALNVTSVECSRGKQSAEVFIEGTDIAQSERSILLHKLSKAQGALKEYVLSVTQWFRCPNLHFKFDDSLYQANALDSIFDQIAQEKDAKKHS